MTLIFRAGVHCGCLLWLLASIVAATSSASASPATMKNASSQDPIVEASEKTLALRALVLDPDGAPVEGAVLFTPWGGKGVTDKFGVGTLSVALNESVESLQVTAVAAVGSVNYLGGARIDLHLKQGVVDAGVISLSPATDTVCDPEWLPTFGAQAGVDRTINAMAVFDDGAGPALYVGGDLRFAGNIAASRIARWDGETWSALGEGTSGWVLAMAVYDDGSGSGPALYAAGAFTEAGGELVGHIARWDGQTWSSLGAGVGSTVHALAVYDDGEGPALYAGGAFTSAGGAAALRVARWDGENWSPLGAGVNNTVRALASHDDGSGVGLALYVGGEFTMAGGAAASRIARWDGENWSTLGAGMNNIVHVLGVFDNGAGGGPMLFAGGNFTIAGSQNANFIARWNGAAWSRLASGMNSGVRSMMVFDDGSGPALYVGGTFTTAGGLPANRIARWTGFFWTPVGDGVVGSQKSVQALAAFDDGSGAGESLYIGGEISVAGGVAAKNIARWRMGAWTPLGDGLIAEGVSGSVNAITVFDDGSGNGPALYVGGDFVVPGHSTTHIGRWDGSSWSSVGGGLSGPVKTLLAVEEDFNGEPALYAGGLFFNPGPLSIRVARWDGSSWSSLGSGSSGFANCLALFDDGSGQGPNLYVGGGTFNVGGSTTLGIVRWNGTSWSAVGGGLFGEAHALVAFDDGSGPALYVGGGFNMAGGAPARSVARWDGVSWSPLGDELIAVLDLAVYDDGSGDGPSLYACGGFSVENGSVANRIARWNGQTWLPLGSGMNATVQSMAVFDDGSGLGPALYAGGHFTSAGGVAVNHLARWDGATWSAVDDGTDGWVLRLAAVDSGPWCGGNLFVGGQFFASPGGDSYIARMRGCAAEPIPGDLNGNGAVGADDLALLLAAWGVCPRGADPCPGDINHDGVVNAQDLAMLLGFWGYSCP